MPHSKEEQQEEEEEVAHLVVSPSLPADFALPDDIPDQNDLDGDDVQVIKLDFGSAKPLSEEKLLMERRTSVDDDDGDDGLDTLTPLPVSPSIKGVPGEMERAMAPKKPLSTEVGVLGRKKK